MTYKFTETGIAHALVQPLGLFPPRQHLAVENVSWGLLDWEADLVLLNGNGYLSEVEIKTSWADLVRDRDKPKHGLRLHAPTNPARQVRMRRFWYAMPQGVWLKAKYAVAEVLPEDAGVIAVTAAFTGTDPGDAGIRLGCEIVKKARTNTNAPALTLQQRYDLARLGVLRYWDRRV